MMTFDNEPELYKIAEHYPGAQVLLRIKVGNEGSVVNLSLKFGADPEDAHLILRKARSLGLVPTGLSFHVGSQSKNVENYLQALEMSAQIFNQAKEHDVPLKIMDIGGGFPIQHFDNEIGVNFDRMASQIRRPDSPALRSESSVHRRAGPVLGRTCGHSGDASEWQNVPQQ